MTVIVIHARDAELAATLEALGIRRRRRRRHPRRSARSVLAAPTPATWAAPTTDHEWAAPGTEADDDGPATDPPSRPFRGWGVDATQADLSPEDFAAVLDRAFGTIDGE